MRILVCIPCLLTGGTEIQTLNLIRALVEGKNRVLTLCYFEHSDQMISAYKNVGSKVTCLSAHGHRIGGYKEIIFLFNGLRKVLREYQPDVVHVQYMAPGAMPILMLNLLGFRNIIATTHTAADIYPNLRLVHFIQRHCVRAFTCITQKAEESYFGSSQMYSENTVLSSRNHFTIYNTLPPYITVTSKPKIHNKDIITLGVVSRLETIKGMDLVVPAFAEIVKLHKNTRLQIVGDGSCRSLMERQVCDLNLSAYVEFVGRQAQENLQDYYDGIDILLMPSRSEGFGLTAIEGMARGCVIVASDVGGLSEVVLDGKVGVLHKNEDIFDIVNKVISLIGDRKSLDTISKAAVEYVSRFDFRTYSTLFNNLYSKLV